MTPTEFAMLQALMKELASDIHLDEVKVRQLEEGLNRKRIAYSVLEEKFKAGFAATEEKPQEKPSEAPVIRRRFLVSRPTEAVRPMPFMEAFRRAVNGLAGQDVYVAPVFDSMVKLGVVVEDERKARLRIGTELARLEEKKNLQKTHQGGGNVPSRYRLVTPVPVGEEDASDLV